MYLSMTFYNWPESSFLVFSKRNSEVLPVSSIFACNALPIYADSAMEVDYYLTGERSGVARPASTDI